ncbi:MAG: metal-dependent hydrolase, partial [Bdellovibrionota bacterium]
MDNVTHTLVGLAAGELIHRSLPAETNDTDRSIRRRLLLIACAVASNFPDLDLVLSPLLPPPLGYLLHHRGHTHTILYSLPQAFMMIAFIWFGWRNARELLRRSQAARTGLLIATLLGFTLHLSMDFLNSYGIHPFHPFDSRWFYGDMIFIIEPLFWISCG